MTTEQFLKGSVFHYPYLWTHEFDRGQSHSKERTCCLAFKSTSPNGIVFLVVLPISDRPHTDKTKSIEIPISEKLVAGLDPVRAAFVHVSEYNIDPLSSSMVRNPNAKFFGRFNRRFAETIAAALAEAMRAKSSRGIDRRT
jgi:hypothetical protein